MSGMSTSSESQNFSECFKTIGTDVEGRELIVAATCKIHPSTGHCLRDSKVVAHRTAFKCI